MTNIIKIFKLDMLIIKQHIKLLIYLIIFPLFLVISSKSLASGIIITMTLISARGTIMLFEIEEKNSFCRFYGFVPVKKLQLVLGRYVFISLSGLGVLIVSLLIQSLALKYIGISINFRDCFLAFTFGLGTYLFSISFQLPGFYKFGAINGSAFSYIPLIFFVLSLYLTSSLDGFGIETISLILNNLNLLSIIFLFISIIITLISLLISINIYTSKE